MMNQILFGVIALLMLAIVGIGGFALYTNPEAITTVGENITARVDSLTESITASSTKSSITEPTSSPGTAPATSEKTFTLAQVQAHNSAEDCYTAINGSVYDVTSFTTKHPGGSAALISLCGIDGSSAFNGQHGGQQRPANELVNFKIGVLAK